MIPYLFRFTLSLKYIVFVIIDAILVITRIYYLLQMNHYDALMDANWGVFVFGCFRSSPLIFSNNFIIQYFIIMIA